MNPSPAAACGSVPATACLPRRCLRAGGWAAKYDLERISEKLSMGQGPALTHGQFLARRL